MKNVFLKILTVLGALFVLLIFVVLVLGGIYFFLVLQPLKKKFAGMKPPLTTVSILPATAQTWKPSLRSIGSVVAIQGVSVNNELAGVVTQVAFESGAVVKKGDLLVHLDTSSEDAQLKGLQAQVNLAKTTLDRAQNLLARKVNSQSDLDTAKAQYDQAQSAVLNIQATIDKKVIRAPFNGRLGIRQINVGQYLAPGTPIVSLQSNDPIYIDFSLPQQNLTDLKIGQPVTATTDAQPGKTFTGKITAIDSTVDPATRNIPIRATFPNPDGKLQPGVFVNTAVQLPEQHAVVTVPQSAITYNPYGDIIYVADKDQKTGHYFARQQFVEIGETRGDQVAVLKGIKAGEEVVSAGAMKNTLQNGAEVLVNNSVQPENKIHPTPEEN